MNSIIYVSIFGLTRKPTTTLKMQLRYAWNSLMRARIGGSQILSLTGPDSISIISSGIQMLTISADPLHLPTTRKASLLGAKDVRLLLHNTPQLLLADSHRLALL